VLAMAACWLSPGAGPAGGRTPREARTIARAGTLPEGATVTSAAGPREPGRLVFSQLRWRARQRRQDAFGQAGPSLGLVLDRKGHRYPHWMGVTGTPSGGISAGQMMCRVYRCLEPCPQKDSNLRTWLRRHPGCTEMLTHCAADGKARTDVRVALKPSAKRCRSRVRNWGVLPGMADPAGSVLRGILKRDPPIRKGTGHGQLPSHDCGGSCCALARGR
jgi:hypothetical protein